MQRLLPAGALVLSLSLQIASAQQATRPATRRGGGRGAATPPPIEAKPQELATIKEKTEQIRSLVQDLRARGAKPELVDDLEVYAHAGQMLIEYPNMFANQAAIARALNTLDQGIERGKQLQSNQPQWNQGQKQILAYPSEIHGAVLPYG